MNNAKRMKEYYKTHPKYVYTLEDASFESNIGNKALNLRFLQKKGFNIPKTFVCEYNAFYQYNKGNETVIENLRHELVYYIEENMKYSIRSSADIEDSSDKSFAGQFKTILNQSGVENIIESILEIWNSLEDIKTQTYSKNFSHNPEEIKMGIIIQEMIIPEYSGVVFTRNPVTGLNETVIESVKGLGENLVQLGKTPERWINKWGEWIEQPADSQIQIEIIARIVKESKKIVKKFGKPVDLEWAYDGENLYWLQLRQITTLKNNKLFSNKLSKEFMPGMIKPLIWSVNIPVVNTSWKQIFEELIGSAAKHIDINELSRPFFYRSYFNMKVMGDIFELLGMPRDLLENLAGIDSEGKDKPSFRPSGRTFYYLPRMLLFGLKLFSFAKYIEKFLRSYQKQYDEIAKMKLNTLDEESCLNEIERLFNLNTQASYFVILTQLLNSLYYKLITNKLKKKKVESESLDFSLFNKRLQMVDPRWQISKLHKEFEALNDTKREVIKKIDFEELVNLFPNLEFTKTFQDFVSKFGYFRDSGNDFSQPAWGETPNIMLKMVLDYKEPKIKKISSEEMKELIHEMFKSPFSKLLFNRAIKYLEYRQTVTNLYSYGYGLFRMFFLRISELFVNKGLIKGRKDIFYMNYNEVKELIKDEQKAKKIMGDIEQRKKEMVEYQNLQLPEIIYDNFLPKPIDETEISEELEGVPTSKGFYIGPVKVVKGINDINKIQEGDIIAIPYSDVSWTPLFAKAKAVISESGGILSHSSIVAREYDIPAIVSVKGATLLTDNTLVAVDAFKGKISILSDTFKLKEEKISLLNK
jgi:pyruvate,water dikinase